jgi:glyoxylase-like metal-dependent hydrolase (beta-lactamase superfamily II)
LCDEAISQFRDACSRTGRTLVFGDGGSIVLVRGSDVVVTGDLFTPGAYPFLDVDHGGSVQGEIAGLNHILDLTVPTKTQEAGIYVIPSHGRICDEADVVEFRDMVVIIRDRIQDMIRRNMTLAWLQLVSAYNFVESRISANLCEDDLTLA